MDINKLYMLNLWQTNPKPMDGSALTTRTIVPTVMPRTQLTKTCTEHVTLPYTRRTRIKNIFHRITQRLIKPAAVQVTTFTTNNTLSTKH